MNLLTRSEQIRAVAVLAAGFAASDGEDIEDSVATAKAFEDFILSGKVLETTE